MARRRLWPLLVVVVLLVGGRLWLRHSVDAEVAVELSVPAPARVELLFVRADADDRQVERDVTWEAPAPAPTAMTTIVSHPVKLPEGRYDVTVRLLPTGRTLVRPLEISGGGRYLIDGK